MEIANKIKIMKLLLETTVNILNDNNIPYYLDCGTLLGCVRDNCIMEHDTDVDITTHLSMWNKLKAINYSRYGLVVKRVIESYPMCASGNMITLRTKYSESLYIDIYTNAAFPLLEKTQMYNIEYNIPVNSDLYLTQLYGEWKIPKKGSHAETEYHRGLGLINSKYKPYWDLNYKIFYMPY